MMSSHQVILSLTPSGSEQAQASVYVEPCLQCIDNSESYDETAY